MITPDMNKLDAQTVMVRFPDGERAVPSSMEVVEGSDPPMHVNTPKPMDGFAFFREVKVGNHVDWHAAPVEEPEVDMTHNSAYVGND